jgi:hypothetical protein
VTSCSLDRTSSNNEACRVALNVAQNCGWAVFPCGANKKPTRPDREGGQGYKDATADPEQIAWLRRNWPGELIGIATGAVSEVDVLDIDTARHEPAAAWWAEASKRIPRTRLHATRSGGKHAYFRHAEGSQTRRTSWRRVSIPGVTADT